MPQPSSKFSSMTCSKTWLISSAPRWYLDFLPFPPGIYWACSKVLQWLLENQLSVEAENCSLHVKMVPFLGFIISSCGISRDFWGSPISINTVSPTITQLQPFWSICPQPSLNLCRHSQTVLDSLKSCFLSKLFLVTPHPFVQFVAEVGVGTVLSQSNGKTHLCTYFFYFLTPTKWNYEYIQ